MIVGVDDRGRNHLFLGLKSEGSVAEKENDTDSALALKQLAMEAAS
jgi:hypothetical protein